MKIWKIRKATLDALEKWWGNAYNVRREEKQPEEEIKGPPTARILGRKHEEELRRLIEVTGTTYNWVFRKLATLVKCPYDDCGESFAIESLPVICPRCKRISYFGGGTLQKPPKKEITESSTTPQRSEKV